MNNPLPPEIEEGNIEYKRQFKDMTDERMLKLISQLLWRIDEGINVNKNGLPQAIYYIGINDDGSVGGLTVKEHNESLKILSKLTRLADAKIISTTLNYHENGVYSKNIIRKFNKNNIKKEIKVALLGSNGVGKSTFLSVLTYGYPDNGMGSARNSIFRFDHELRKGETSSIKYELLGYTDKGEPINYDSDFMCSWENIVKNCNKLIYFIDLPGSQKYLRTSIFGMLAHKPQFIIIMINPCDIFENKSIDSHTETCRKLCIDMNIPFIYLATRLDQLDNQKIETVKNIMGENIIFVSNVTLKGYNDLHKTMNDIINNNINYDINKDQLVIKTIETDNSEANIEFMINDVFYIYNVGIVVSGILFDGIIELGTKLLVGPINNSFVNTQVISIHRNQIPCKKLVKGQVGCFVIKHNNKQKITKHMMLISQNNISNLTNKIQIALNDLYGLKVGLTVVGYTRNIIEMMEIIKIDHVDNIFIVDCKFNSFRYIKKDHIIIRYVNKLIVGRLI